jgi:hypothetical protein
MTQTTYEIGARVVRVAGGPGYMGKRGEVVEAKENRVRVKWDDEYRPNFYRPEEMSLHAGIRTWVNVSVVRPE